jgi:hypothetical protein
MKEQKPEYKRSKDLEEQLKILSQLRGYNLLSPNRQQLIRLSLYLNERANRLYKVDSSKLESFFEKIENYGISAMLWSDYNCHLAADTIASAIGPRVDTHIYSAEIPGESEIKSPEISLRQIPQIEEYGSFDSIENFFKFVNENIPCVVRENLKKLHDHSFVVLDYITFNETTGYLVWEKYGLGNYPFQIRFIPQTHFEELEEIPSVAKIPKK